MLFWFAGFIALAVFDRDLHDAVVFYYGFVYEGCDGTGNICEVITAAVVFGAFEWYVPLHWFQWSHGKRRKDSCPRD